MGFLSPKASPVYIPAPASAPESPEPPPMLGAPQGTKPKKKSQQTSFLNPTTANAKQKSSPSFGASSSSGTPSFGENTLLGQV